MKTEGIKESMFKDEAFKHIEQLEVVIETLDKGNDSSKNIFDLISKLSQALSKIHDKDINVSVKELEKRINISKNIYT